MRTALASAGMSKSQSPARRAIGACLAPVLALSTVPAMTGCGGGAAMVPPSAPQAAAERPPSPDAVWMQLEPEASDEHWTLLGNDEKVLCELPCARWVSPGSGAFLQYARPGTLSVLRVSLPADLGPPGGSMVAVARLGNASERTGTKLILGGTSLAILGLILFPALDNITQDLSYVALGVAIGLGAPLLVAGIYVRVKSHPADVLVKGRSGATAAPPHTTFALGPGFVEAAGPSPGGFHVVLTPLGAAGTF